MLCLYVIPYILLASSVFVVDFSLSVERYSRCLVHLPYSDGTTARLPVMKHKFEIAQQMGVVGFAISLPFTKTFLFIGQVWRKRLHHLASPDLREALGACVAALEAMDHPDTTLLCSVYEALARTLASASSAGNADNVGNYDVKI